MSRGGRGGGFRGGRGGRGGAGGGPIIPGMDENMEFIEKKPSELYPAYNVPTAAPLTRKEDKSVSYFLLFREQVHDGPLYTQTRTLSLDPGEPARTYGQEQINKRYGVKNKATVDPFLAMPTYSQRFTRPERALPDLASRPFAKEFFPAELHATLEGDDAGAKRKGRNGKKTLALSNITELRTAEDIFMGGTAEGDLDSHSKALALLEKLGEGEEGGVEDLLAEEDEWVQGNDGEEGAEEEEYDDESDNDDYNAEQYFDDGEGDEDMDEGGGGGDEY